MDPREPDHSEDDILGRDADWSHDPSDGASPEAPDPNAGPEEPDMGLLNQPGAFQRQRGPEAGKPVESPDPALFEELRELLPKLMANHPNLEAEAEKYGKDHNVKTMVEEDLLALMRHSTSEMWEANPELYVALLQAWDSIKNE